MSKITDYRIVIPENYYTSEYRAASFLRKCIKLVCGKTLEVVGDSTAPTELEIVVGKTNREELDGLNIERSASATWEYIITSKGKRVYLCGLGITHPEAQPFTSSYAQLDDGGCGNAVAAYRFVEDVLKYNFLDYVSNDYPETPDLEMPLDYRAEHTYYSVMSKPMKVFNGASVYALPATAPASEKIGTMVIKTDAGKVIVIDGAEGEVETLIDTIKKISGKDVPTISAWFITHIQPNYAGALAKICADEKYAAKINVEKIYANYPDVSACTGVSARRTRFYNNIVSGLAQASDKIVKVFAGDKIKVDEMEIEILRTYTDELSGKVSINNTGMAFKISCSGKKSLLILGELDPNGLRDVMAKCPAEKLKSDMVQLSAGTFFMPEFYSIVDPDAYIWQLSECFWYDDFGEGHNTYPVGSGVRENLQRSGVSMDKVHFNTTEIVALEF